MRKLKLFCLLAATSSATSVTSDNFKTFFAALATEMNHLVDSVRHGGLGLV